MKLVLALVFAIIALLLGCSTARYEAIGSCPPTMGPSVLVLDNRTGQLYCAPLPVDKILHAPHPPSSQRVPA